MKILAIIYPEGISLYKTPEQNPGVHLVFIGEVRQQVTAIGAYNNEWCLSMWNHPHDCFFFVDFIQQGG